MPSARTAALTCAALALALTSAPSPASAAEQALSRTTSVGVHNAYETATFPHFADALDSGAGLLELDVWTDEWFGNWRVNHELVGQHNNCAGAATATSPTACATCAPGTRPTQATRHCCSRSR
ncbi:PI-PLC domain-containing protein [Nocardiopsis akebiae]|uniref:hypothetical protein n=1 Tax=Nocardiopsis akebiae TaxID=2831968 RepID=UPI002016591D|nr:hypothetical protein [Nocardiopsis akebiae]